MDEFIYKKAPEKICRNCGGKMGRHSKACPEYPKTLVEDINQFVILNAPYLQEGGKKIDKLIDGLLDKCSDLSSEERWHALEKMKLARERELEKFKRPPRDLQNELELIDKILGKWHPIEIE